LIACYSDPEDVLWLGRTAAFKDFSFRCSKKCDTNGEAYGTTFNKGGVMERRDFVQGEPAVDVLNSTELRLRGFVMEKRGLF